MTRFVVAVAVAALAASTASSQISPPPGPVADSGPSLAEIYAADPAIVINQDNTPGNASADLVITKPGRYVVDSNRAFGEIRITGNGNRITRNQISSGSISQPPSPFLPNDVGPVNNLTSPWANFIR